MPRAQRTWFPGAVYHIIQRGNGKQNIFLEHRDYQWFLKTVQETKKEKGFKVYCYALMGNHYHMTIEATQDHISDIMHAINTAYAVRFNKKYQKTGHLFQGRFKSFLVDTDNYLLELSRYTHLNPVKAGFASSPGEYPWTSYSAYVQKKEWRDELVDPGPVLLRFKERMSSRYKDYKSYIYENISALGDGKDWLRANLRYQRFLGSKEFAAKYKKGA